MWSLTNFHIGSVVVIFGVYYLHFFDASVYRPNICYDINVFLADKSIDVLVNKVNVELRLVSTCFRAFS